MKKRVFLIVLDSFGVGAAPDAAQFGDAGCSTLGRISRSPRFSCENLRSMGLGNIDGVQGVPPVPSPASCYCRMTERSAGKDTTVGHWEIAGAVSPRPLPTYPHGFPEGLLRELEEKTGRGWLCNRPYSGTEVLLDYGEEHLRTGKLIVYTSADSVFQIAAHTDIVPTDELYRICECARALLCGGKRRGTGHRASVCGGGGSFLPHRCAARFLSPLSQAHSARRGERRRKRGHSRGKNSGHFCGARYYGLASYPFQRRGHGGSGATCRARL